MQKEFDNKMRNEFGFIKPNADEGKKTGNGGRKEKGAELKDDVITEGM